MKKDYNKKYTDKQRIDALSTLIKREGPLILHNGTAEGAAQYGGLAFEGPLVTRSIRSALDGIVEWELTRIKLAKNKKEKNARL